MGATWRVVLKDAPRILAYIVSAKNYYIFIDMMQFEYVPSCLLCLHTKSLASGDFEKIMEVLGGTL